MIRYAAGAVVGACVVVLAACTSDEASAGGNYDNEREACGESGACTCKQGSCSFECKADEPCNYTCLDGSTCSLSCPKGGCNVSGGGDITLDCAGGGCKVECSGAVCQVRSCTQGCIVTCGGASTCSSSCNDTAKGCLLAE